MACVTEINAGRFPSGMALLATGKHDIVSLYVHLSLGDPVDTRGEDDSAEDYYSVRDLDTLPGLFHADDLFRGISRSAATRLREGPIKSAQCHSPRGDPSGSHPLSLPQARYLTIWRARVIASRSDALLASMRPASSQTVSMKPLARSGNRHSHGLPVFIRLMELDHDEPPDDRNVQEGTSSIRLCSTRFPV